MSVILCIGIVISMTMPFAYAGTNVDGGPGDVGTNKGSWYNAHFGGKYNGIRVSIADKTAGLRVVVQ